MRKSIIIIGAGISGLSAGCYAQMNGYQTQIFEMHDKPGGVCTSWKRKGYTFDGCIHWLSGSALGTTMHTIWEELGAIQSREIIYHEVLKQVIDGDNNLFVYTDINRFQNHLKQLSPADARLIDEFARAVRRFIRFDPPFDKPFEWMGIRDYIKMLPYLRDYRRYRKISVLEFSKKFKDPFLRKVFPVIFPPELPMLLAILNLVIMSRREGGFPKGGSLAFAQAIEKRYISLGGKIQYHSKVERILTHNDQAIGVRLIDGNEYFTDIVVSAADGHATIFDMLEGKYINERIYRFYNDSPLWKPLVYVSFGLNLDLSSEPPIVTYQPSKPLYIAGEKIDWISLMHYCFDSSLAPVGKSVLIVWIDSNFKNWQKLYANHPSYEAEKKQIVDMLIEEIEERFPGFSSRIEVVDIATPMTWVRYTNNWRGAYEGWLPTVKTFGIIMNKTLPGLSNFYMCGQWVEPGGGVPIAAISGRNIIQHICRKDKRRFHTSIPKIGDNYSPP